MTKKKKTKAQKRLNRRRRELNLETIAALTDVLQATVSQQGWEDSEAEDWQRESTQAFIQYVELIYAKLITDTDSEPINPLETRKKIYDLAKIAWNMSTDSDSLEEAIGQLNRLDSLPLPKDVAADMKEWIEIMIEMRWRLYARFRTYVDEIEFTPMPNGMHDLAIGMSLREE